MNPLKRGVSPGAQLFKTSMSGDKIYEGILPVHKPTGVTSADVLRKLQAHFNRSATFQPWIKNEIQRRQADQNPKSRRRRFRRPEVKIGHGGTLDPLATGVLITGIGRATKHLSQFLECAKTYETIVLFGAETDTYDRLGKIVRRAPYEHVTREIVEKALKQFRGKIMQRPPIFSAKKIQGKKLYEYARDGIEPPVEIQSRPVEVYDIRILEWYEPGTHEYMWPEEELPAEEKAVAEKMLDKEASIPVASEAEAQEAAANISEGTKKRKASPSTTENIINKNDVLGDGTTTTTTATTKRFKGDPENTESTETSAQDANVKGQEDNNTEKETETSIIPAKTEEPPATTATTTTTTTTTTKEKQSSPPAAAAKITMTVSSGFYVRSLAHDLGKAVGSCGLMSELVRTTQAGYTLDSEKILEYKDLDAGEEVWSPKVIRFLEEWQEKNP